MRSNCSKFLRYWMGIKILIEIFLNMFKNKVDTYLRRVDYTD